MNAILNSGRLNAFRLNAIARPLWMKRAAIVSITLNGSPLRVRAGSVSIRNMLNDAPDTATFTVMAVASSRPPTGGRVRIVAGVPLETSVLFAGRLQRVTETYVGRPATVAWQCDAIDDTAAADWIRPFGSWDNVSATTVAQALVSSFVPGFSAAGVAPGLAPITLALDGTTRLNDALQQICKLIGGYFYWLDGVLHLFVNPEAGLTPEPLDGAPGRLLLNDPALTYANDDAQIRTRNYGKGHSEVTLAAVPAGDTTIPIANAVMFTSSGGRALVGTQRAKYTGVVLGGAGALVGPGVTPSAALLVAPVGGSGVTPGAHTYACSWVTAAGETLPSPGAAVTVSNVSPTPAIASASPGTWQGGVAAGTTIRYRMYVTPDHGVFSFPSADVIITANGCRPTVSFYTTADMRGRYVQIHRRDNNQTTWCGVGNMFSGTPGLDVPFPVNQAIGVLQTWTDPTVYYTDGGGGFDGLPTNPGSMVSAQVSITGIAVGPATVTSRRLYRTVANGSALLRLATIADNTTTTYTDAAADGALGAAAPASDTSGLTMPAGQISVGATALPVSSTVWALPGGGWAVVGNGEQVIRYTGISGNQLTGIGDPATGLGAITAPINFNSTITCAPMLIGVTWNPPPNDYPRAVPVGTDVAIWVQRDDVAAQQLLAQRYPTGIVENVIVDGRRAEPSLTALCDADLAMYSRSIQTLTYGTLDAKSRAGRPVTVSLSPLLLAVTLTIQDVTIDNIGAGPIRFHVTASSLVITLESLLRNMVDGLAVEGS